MTPQKITLHFIQDIPTPHNNVLLKALRGNSFFEVKIWYARVTHPQYSFKAELAYEVGIPIVYGSRFPSFKLLRAAVCSPRDRLFIVGWMNPTTRLLVPLLCLLGRPYNMWFDMPADRRDSVVKNLIRDFYYWLLKRSNARVFVVGKNAVNYFERRGFPEARLVNLPIFVKPSGAALGVPEQEAIRRRYRVAGDGLFVITGSRLIHEKGFDLLIDAVSMLRTDIRDKVKVLIVGRGPEKDSLADQVSRLKLSDCVFFEDWMSNDDFDSHLHAADVAVHPARFDAYGGITLSAMAAGLPVIGGDGAGSAADRIVDGVNGWLYPSEDLRALASLIELVFADRGTLARAGQAAKETAGQYGPDVGAEIIKNNTI